MCQSSAPSASTDSSESALGTPSPHTPRSHVSPLETPPPPAANNAALSHLTRPHARRDAHPRSTQPPRAPRSPRASRTARPGPCAAHAATAVSHFVTSQTAQPHRPPPLPDVRHGRQPGKPAPSTPLHPLPGTPRRTGPAHPQRRSPGCRLRQRLSAPPAARAVHRWLFCPAPPRKPPDARCGASQRGPTPARSSPRCRLPPATPSAPVGSHCSPRQAPAKQPCTAQQTPQVAAVRSS